LILFGVKIYLKVLENILELNNEEFNRHSSNHCYHSSYYLVRGFYMERVSGD
jgi:hypothetical protein